MKNSIRSILTDDPEIAELLRARSRKNELPTLEAMKALFKGEDGYTPKKGKDYFTKEEIEAFKQAVTPEKYKDYFTAKEVGEMVGHAAEMVYNAFMQLFETEIRDQITPKKGVDYRDGIDADEKKLLSILSAKIPTPEQVAKLVQAEKGDKGEDAELTGQALLEAISGLTGADKEAFAKKLGAMIDISQIRNAQSFMYNGKRYKIAELMHGGGGSTSSGANVTTQYLLNATQDGDNILIDLTQLTNWATFDQAITFTRNNMPQTQGASYNFTISGSILTGYYMDANDIFNLTYSFS